MKATERRGVSLGWIRSIERKALGEVRASYSGIDVDFPRQCGPN